MSLSRSNYVRPLYREGKDRRHILKVGKYLKADTASYTRRYESAYSIMSKKTVND